MTEEERREESHPADCSSREAIRHLGKQYCLNLPIREAGRIPSRLEETTAIDPRHALPGVLGVRK